MLWSDAGASTEVVSDCGPALNSPKIPSDLGNSLRAFEATDQAWDNKGSVITRQHPGKEPREHSQRHSSVGRWPSSPHPLAAGTPRGQPDQIALSTGKVKQVFRWKGAVRTSTDFDHVSTWAFHHTICLFTACQVGNCSLSIILNDGSWMASAWKASTRLPACGVPCFLQNLGSSVLGKLQLVSLLKGFKAAVPLYLQWSAEARDSTGSYSKEVGWK